MILPGRRWGLSCQCFRPARELVACSSTLSRAEYTHVCTRSPCQPRSRNGTVSCAATRINQRRRCRWPPPSTPAPNTCDVTARKSHDATSDADDMRASSVEPLKLSCVVGRVRKRAVTKLSPHRLRETRNHLCIPPCSRQVDIPIGSWTSVNRAL